MKEAVQRFAYGQHEVTLETGRIARQASGAVLAAMGDTVCWRLWSLPSGPVIGTFSH